MDKPDEVRLLPLGAVCLQIWIQRVYQKQKTHFKVHSSWHSSEILIVLTGAGVMPAPGSSGRHRREETGGGHSEMVHTVFDLFLGHLDYIFQ